MLLSHTHTHSLAGDRKNCVFAGTLVMRGQGTAVVVATGDASQLGQVQFSIDHMIEITHFAPRQTRANTSGFEFLSTRFHFWMRANFPIARFLCAYFVFVQINSLVNNEEDEQTHLQEQLAHFGRFIGGLTLVVGVASFLLARFRCVCVFLILLFGSWR